MFHFAGVIYSFEIRRSTHVKRARRSLRMLAGLAVVAAGVLALPIQTFNASQNFI